MPELSLLSFVQIEKILGYTSFSELLLLNKNRHGKIAGKIAENTFGQCRPIFA